mmetsp:Transcript_49588/g.106783  ORF Transcript_49588/g.106783 Transcript_49588/m.106783 type:complete len:129 (+) Transcript_49588:345-731(+)
MRLTEAEAGRGLSGRLLPAVDAPLLLLLSASKSVDEEMAAAAAIRFARAHDKGEAQHKQSHPKECSPRQGCHMQCFLSVAFCEARDFELARRPAAENCAESSEVLEGFRLPFSSNRGPSVIRANTPRT